MKQQKLRKALSKKVLMPSSKKWVFDESCELNQSDFSTLLQAKTAWDNIDHFRETRTRNRNYAFGKQWNDIITTPDGREISEEQYLKEQGKVPLKNNLIRQLVKNVIGQFRSAQTEPVCVSRDREEQQASEMMSIAIQYAYQLNKLNEIDGRTLEEFLISGGCFHKVSHNRRNGKTDVWIDVVNPNRVFFNQMEDFRHWDCTLIGELHDMPIADILSRFAKGSRKRAVELRSLYSQTTCQQIENNYTNLTAERLENLDFFVPAEDHLCRVIEVWRLENRERLKCHDIQSGRYYACETSEQKDIEAENKRRLAEGEAAGLAPDEVALIEWEWFIDRFWYYRFFTPFGQILDEGETPYWHGEHPYVFKLYPLSDGEVHSFVEDVIDQQRYINRLITMIDFIMGSSAKGVLLYPEDQLPDGMNIEDVAEQWARYNGIILFRPRPGSPLPQQISVNATNVGAYELLNLQMQMLNDISGVNSAMQGLTPPVGTAASLFAQQTQNASLNLIDLFESYKIFRQERDTKVMKLIQQYYQEERYFNIGGSAYTPEAHLYTPEKVQNIEFDLTISEAASTPAFRSAANNLLLDLFRMGQISIEMLLENGAFPFSDRLLQSLKQQKESTPPMNKQPMVPPNGMQGINPMLPAQPGNLPNELMAAANNLPINLPDNMA